jgi:hypothetical protein
MALRLQPGHFYLSKGGDIWCCYRLRKLAPEHAAADCINTMTSEVEYFYIDGRYDEAGQREHTLVKECGPTL